MGWLRRGRACTYYKIMVWGRIYGLHTRIVTSTSYQASLLWKELYSMTAVKGSNFLGLSSPWGRTSCWYDIRRRSVHPRGECWSTCFWVCSCVLAVLRAVFGWRLETEVSTLELSHYLSFLYVVALYYQFRMLKLVLHIVGLANTILLLIDY